MVVREGAEENCTLPTCGGGNWGSNAVDLVLLILFFNNKEPFHLYIVS